MGNENSKSKELAQNGKIPEKHENGSVNGVSANITSNGLDFNGETVVKINGGPLSLNHAIESTEPDCVVVESVTQKAEAPVISETPETPATPEKPETTETPEPPATPATPATPEPAVKKEEAKKKKGEKVRGFGNMFKKKAEPPAEPVESVQEKEISNDDQTDVSLPATEPQPESGSIGDEAATMIVAERSKDLENLHQKAEISTQTDTKTEADISTQTGGDDDTTINTQSPVEEVVVETAATEDQQQLNESVVMAEEVVEETAGEEPRGDQTAEITIEEVVIMGNDVYENIVFRAERVEVTDNYEITHIKTDVPEEESVNKTEPEITAEPELTPNRSITECEIVSEDNNVDETVLLEFSFSLPKVVADCVEAVFAADSDSTDFAAVNTSQPCVDEVITEDNIEGAREVSADVVVIKVAEPEYNAVTPEAREANGLPSLDEKPVTTVVETITEVVCEEPNPTSANQVEELSVPVVIEILVEEKSAHEEVTTDEVMDVSEEEGPSNELITTEELLEDTLNSPDNEVKPEPVPEVIATDETAKVGKDVIVHEGPETVEEAEPSPATVKDKTEVILEAAIDVLSQEFSAITPQDPAMDNDLLLEEEVIVATSFMPLSGEQDTSLTISEEPSETSAEELNEEAIEALSNEFEAVSGSVEDDTTVLESSTGGEVTSSNDPVEIKTEASDDVLLVTGESEPHVSVQEELVEDVTPSVVAVEEPTDPSPVISEKPVEQSASLLEPQMLVVSVETMVDEVTEEILHEMDNSGDVSATVDVKRKIATSDEFMAESVEVVFETIVEEIIMEDITAECNVVTTVEEAPEIIENSKDSDIATSDQSVAECVEAVLETIVEEIITEDVATEFNHVTSDKEAPEITEGEKAENESLVNSTDSTQTAETILSTDMNNLLARLQSACTSVVVDSAYSLGGFKMSSMGYTITVTIHVAPNKEQQ